MVRVSPPTVSAASGELSALMQARRDYTRFQNGARACRGFLPLPEGPATRLPGTRFMGFTHGGGAADARLMAFVFRDEDAVLLEWTEGLLRFWRGGQPVTVAGSPLTLPTPYTLAQARRLQPLQSADRVYLTEGELAPRTLSRFGLTAWTLAETVFTGGPFADRNLDPAVAVKASAATGAVTLIASAPLFAAHHANTLFELREVDTTMTPYWAADVAALLGDRVYYDGKCYQIVGFDGQAGQTGAAWTNVGPPPVTPWTDNQVVWTQIAPESSVYAAWAPAALIKLGERRNAAGYTWEATGITVAASGRKTGVNPPVHDAGDWLAEKGGVVWRFLHDGSGVVRITAVTGPLTATGVVERRLPDGLVTTPSYRWAEQAWSQARGWPRAIGAFGQRHIYGGTPSEPRRLWHGVIGGTTDMTAGPGDDDAFSYTLTASRQRLGRVLSIAEGAEEFFVLTDADEIVGRATDADRAFARETARYSVVSEHGSADAPCEMVDGLPVFLAKDGARLLYHQVDQASGRLKPENLTAVSRHILAGRAIKMVRQQNPLPLLWILLADGDLACCTFEPGQQAVGFSRHNLGGPCTDIEVLPSADGRSEDLWLVVRRSLGGTERHCVERMERPFVDLDGAGAALADAWHQMCAVRRTGAPATDIGGLTHLAGETVTAWTEHGAFPGLTVSALGMVTLPRPVTSAIVGLDVTDRQRFDTLDVVSGQPDGGDDGRLRTHRLTALRVHRSAGGTFEVMRATDGGAAVTTGPEPLFPRPGPLDGQGLREGVVELPGHRGWAHQTWLSIRPEPGAPLTIAARTPTIMITDD